MMLKLIVAATIVEALVETLKMVWDKDKICKAKVLAIFIGVFISIVCQLDLLSAVDLPVILPVFGYILTGILISRGANWVSDFFGMIKGIKEV